MTFPGAWISEKHPQKNMLATYRDSRCVELMGALVDTTVDGSEIPRPTTWDGAKTLQIMEKLPTSTG